MIFELPLSMNFISSDSFPSLFISTAFISVRGTMQSRTFTSENSRALWNIFTSSSMSSSLPAFSMLDCTR